MLTSPTMPTTTTYTGWLTRNWDFGTTNQYPALKYAEECVEPPDTDTTPDKSANWATHLRNFVVGRPASGRHHPPPRQSIPRRPPPVAIPLLWRGVKHPLDGVVSSYLHKAIPLLRRRVKPSSGRRQCPRPLEATIPLLWRGVKLRLTGWLCGFCTS